MTAGSIIKYISKKYELNLTVDGGPFHPIDRFAIGEVRGYPIEISQRYVSLPSGDGGTGGFPFTFIDIKLNKYIPNVLIKRKYLFIPLFADSDYINMDGGMNKAFKKYKRFSTKNLFIRTDEENIDYYKELITNISELSIKILSGAFKSGAIIVDANTLRYVKSSYFISFKKENFEKTLLSFIELAEELENQYL